MISKSEERKPFYNFGIAALAVLAATVITLLIPAFGEGAMYFLFLTAIVVSALYGDWRGGVLAAALSLVANFLLLEFLSKSPRTAGDWLVLCVFGLAVGLTVFLCHAQAKTENARRVAENKYRAIFEDAITGIYETTVGGSYAAANPQLARMFGYESADELIWEAENLNRKFYVEPERRAEFIRLVEENGTLAGFESEIYRRDGTRVWISENALAVRDKRGKLVGFQGTTIDITDRKLAEAALKKAHNELEQKVAERTKELAEANEILRESEEKFRSLVEVSSEMIWEVDENTDYTYISPKSGEFNGYEPAEIIGQKPFMFMPPEEAARVAKIFKQIGKNFEPFYFLETITVNKDGSVSISETSGVPFFDDAGNFRGYRGVARDVTERKRAAAALEASEKRHRELVENARDYIYTVGFDGRYISLNQAGKEAFELTDEEVPEQTLETMIAPEYYSLMRQKIAEKLEGKVTLYEVEIIRKDKSRVPVELNSWVTYEDGKPVAIQGIARDITERRQAEVALRESEKRYRELVENAKDLIYTVNFDGRYTSLNRAGKEFVGLTDEQVRQTTTHDIIPPEYHPLLEKKIQEKIAGKDRTIYEIEMEINGKRIPIELNSWLIYEDGKPVASQGIARDLTERKQAEAALRASEMQLRSVVTAAPVVLFALDGDHTFTLCEGKSLELLGLHPGEIVGKTVSELYGDYPAILADIERCFIGETFTSITEYEGFVFECRYTPTFDEQKRIVGIICVSIDVTETKRIENELRASQKQLRELSAHLQSVREEDRKNLARELHDELGQQLTALKIDLVRLDEKTQNGGKDAPAASSAKNRIPAMISIIDTAMETTRKIVAQLRPGALDELGLAAAMEWQVQEFQKRTGIVCDLHIEFDEAATCQLLKTTVFRILQECLTNIVRHASATRVRITLRDEGYRIFFEVQDNGRGITKEQAAGNGDSFGILGMRERALLLNGTIEISSAEIGGACITVSVPRPEELVKFV